MSVNRKSIVFLGTQMEVAGAQRMLLSQARWFHKKGYAVRAMFLYDKHQLQQTWQQANPFPVVALRPRKPNPLTLVVLLFSLFGILKKADILVTYTPHSNLFGLTIGWLLGVPVRIGTHHGYIEGSSRWLSWLHGRLTNSPCCHAMVAVSAQVRQYAVKHEKVNPNRIVVIENGIEPAEELGFDPGAPRRVRDELGIHADRLFLLTVGRLTLQKGHTVLLQALPQIIERRSQVCFVFAGDGSQRDVLINEARQVGVEPYVKFLGIRHDIPVLLRAADAFIQPSLWEGLSLALLEALQAGLPVVATRVEGVVDVVEDGVHALLVPPKDADALAAAILRILEDEPLRARLAKAGKARVQEAYSIDAMCTRYEKLIHELQDAA